MTQAFKLADRNIWRNKTRFLFSSLAVGISMALLLLIAIYERTREIGPLGTIGLKPRQIATTFILEGTLIPAMIASKREPSEALYYV